MADWDFCKQVDLSSNSPDLDEGLENLHRWEPEVCFFFSRGRSVKLQSFSNLLRDTVKQD